MKETLVLTFNKGEGDINTQVYGKTLKYIADNLPTAEVYQFTGNEDLLKFVKGHEFSLVVYTNEISRDTAYLLKGLGLVQILIGMRDDLMDASDILIDPLVRKSERYLVGTKYLLSSILKQISPEAVAGIMGIDPNTLAEEVSHNQAEIELLGTTRLYKKLEWDSNFFGINVGYMSCLRLTPNIERHVGKFIRKEKIDLLEYCCNCHDRESVVTSERNGYSFVDIRLTFEKFLHGDMKVPDKTGYCVKKGEGRDIERLKEIATDIYKYSRYYFDTNFDRGKVVEFYRNWAEKAIRGQFDDYAYVLYGGQAPVGFCAIKKTRKHAARIGLFGMDPQYGGKGLARHLLNTSMQRLKDEEGVNYIEVVTQGRNYAAQRLYQKCGFVTRSTELWYHKWFR